MGNKTPAFVATAVKFDGDRIALPAQSAELAKLKGDKSIDCWLLVVTAGRYRLLPKTEPEPSATETYTRTLREWQKIAAPGDILENTNSNELAAIQARIIPTAVTPKDTSWRVIVPKEAKMLVPAGEDTSFVFVLVVAGFIELWFPDTLRRAVSVPLAEVLQ